MMKSWQIFYCELQDDGNWFQGKRPAYVIMDKKQAESSLKRLNKNACFNQKFVMVEV